MCSFEEMSDDPACCANGHLLCWPCADRWSAQKRIQFEQQLDERKSKVLADMAECDAAIEALESMRHDVNTRDAEDVRQQCLLNCWSYYSDLCTELDELELIRTDEAEIIRRITCPLCRVGGGFSPRPVD